MKHMRSNRLVLSLFLLLTVCLPVAASPLSQGDGTTIIMASDNPMGNVTPFYYETWVGGEMGPYVYDSLFLRTPDLRLVPGLATGYSVSDDGLTYTVSLRQGVKWHDGQSFDADDVAFSYRWMAGMGGTRGSSLKGLITDTIKIVSPYEVELQLEKTNPFFVDRALTIEIIPEHVWNSIFNETTTPPEDSSLYDMAHDFEARVGTGPFKFIEMERDQTYRFERNDDYWGPQALVDRLVVTVIKDRSVMMQALQAGEVDMAVVSLEPSTVEQFRSAPDLSVVSGPDMANESLFINVERPALAYKAVRQAIAQAIDIDKIVELVTLNTGTKLTAGYPHPDLWWAPDDLYHTYDPTAANELLDAEGFARGDDGIRTTPEGERLAFELVIDANSPTEVRTGELIKTMLAEIGIEITPQAMDINSGVEKVWPEYSAANGRDYDLALWLWSNYPMLNRWATPMLFDPRLDGVGWANISGYINPEVEPLVDTFLSSPSEEEQIASEQALYGIVAEDVPFVPLFAPGGNFAFRNSKYDGYQYKLGVGIHNRWTFMPESAWSQVETISAGQVADQVAAQPMAAETDTETADEAIDTAKQGGSIPTWLWALIITIVVCLAVVTVILMRKRR